MRIADKHEGIAFPPTIVQMTTDAFLAALPYGGIHDFVVALAVFVVALAIILVANLSHSSTPARGPLFVTGWILVALGCGTVFGLVAIGDITHGLTAKLIAKQVLSNGLSFGSSQSLMQQDSRVQQTIETYKIIVPLVVGGFGVSLVAAGINLPKRRELATDEF